IQKEALQQTEKRLQASGVIERVCLKLEGHENVEKYLKQEVKAAIFNLGFLPGSDKTIITKAETTIVAVEALMTHLCFGGRIILVVYYGHHGGMSEKDALLKFARNISQERFNVLQYQFINQVNSPPFVLVLEKKEVKK
ncbi:MAG: class I SAM-dependent methyltransferase, partial [Lactobacillales bacterium]|nr:class I SAM-dependent methyltransferase [Lactobacillales bacterium]